MDTATTHPVKRIVLLGAGGQLGRVLYNSLQGQFLDAEIVGSIRKEAKDTRDDNSAKYLVFNPFTDDWQKLKKVDVLINCIGIIKETPAFTFEKVHEGIIRLILANRQLLGDPRIIHISALGADENNSIPFLQTKGKADKALLEHKNAIVVRPSIVCTPDTMLIQKLRLLASISRYLFTYLPFPAPLLETRIQPIMPSDLAELISKLCYLPDPPSLIAAVGPSPLSVEQLIQVATHNKTRFIRLPGKFSEMLVSFMSKLFPGLINKSQYQLLQANNIYAPNEIEDILGRKLQSTEPFWKI